MRLDTAVGKVAHPTRQTQCTRIVLGGRAEVYALHATTNKHMQRPIRQGYTNPSLIAMIRLRYAGFTMATTVSHAVIATTSLGLCIAGASRSRKLR